MSKEPLLPLRIETLFAIVASDETGEGLPAMKLGHTQVPLIAADPARLDSIKEMAQFMASATGQRMRVVHFTAREDGEWIEP